MMTPSSGLQRAPEVGVPLTMEGRDLALVWGRVLLHVVANPGTAISPLVMSVAAADDGKVIENAAIRKAIDDTLSAYGYQAIDTVAGTIFPQSMWRYCGYDRTQLFAEYLANVPRYRGLARHKNGRGLYFERLIAYGDTQRPVNQLAFIIDQYNARRGVRASMLQASTFDPTIDHTPAAQLGFPCLQHVSFVPVGHRLIMNAFYATQQLFDKAYGNLLGLMRLGAFMAGEMELTFAKLNCFVGVEKLERTTKSDERLRQLAAAVRGAITHSD